jgi:hypothetical protein
MKIAVNEFLDVILMGVFLSHDIPMYSTDSQYNLSYLACSTDII